MIFKNCIAWDMCIFTAKLLHSSFSTNRTEAEKTKKHPAGLRVPWPSPERYPRPISLLAIEEKFLQKQKQKSIKIPSFLVGFKKNILILVRPLKSQLNSKWSVKCTLTKHPMSAFQVVYNWLGITWPSWPSPSAPQNATCLTIFWHLHRSHLPILKHNKASLLGI